MSQYTYTIPLWVQLSLCLVYFWYAFIQAYLVEKYASTTIMFSGDLYDVPYSVMVLWAPVVTIMIIMHWILKPINGVGIYHHNNNSVIQ